MTTEQKLKEMGVTILHSKPDIFERCEKEFGVVWENTIFANDPHIHTKHELTDDIIEHELIHIRQQRDSGGKDKWWEVYFNDPNQRLIWEMEAYKYQYNFLKDKIERGKLASLAYFWALNLSGKAYGFLLNTDEALKQIKT